MPPSKPAHLEPSELGTKEYWDNLYKTEIVNHENNPEDKGTVWFDDSDAEAKMAQFLADLDAEGALNAKQVLDLGCGNGSLLRAVREELWADGLEEEEDEGEGKAVRLLGVDYSESSVKLAKSIEAADEDSEDAVPIEFAVWDMLEGSAGDLQDASKTESETKSAEDAACWDLILDKGTFDAISLGNAQNADAPTTPVEIRYRRQILNLLRVGGKFLITSCNWTEPELCAWMVDDDEEEGASALPYKLYKAGRVAYPSFQFGGVQGQTVCTVCFEKRSR